MALIKIINVGEELIFDLTEMREGTREISVVLTEKAGRKAVLKITADRSIPIRHVRQITLEGRGNQTPGEVRHSNGAG